MRILKLLTLLCIATMVVPSCKEKTTDLKKELNDITQNFQGEVGIALICQEDTICINGNTHFPTFSVMKFHQALAVCNKMRMNKELDSTDIKVSGEDLNPNTYSPMKDQYPNGGVFSLQQLLEYTLVNSDNNACDILFKNIASPVQVDSFIHSLGINECAITWTEEEQHADMSRYLDNWTTPLSAAQLIGLFYETSETDEYSRFIWQTMAKCQTGANRIPKYISDSTICFVHKTGTGGILPDGKIMGINDIACIVFPNGKHIELAIFIKDASCDPADCEELIATIAKTCIIKYGENNETAPS